MKYLRTTYPEQTWTGWVVLFLGALLTVCTAWLTLMNLESSVILYIFVPGAAIGAMLMIIGALGIRVAGEINGATGADRKHMISGYLTYFAMGISSGSVAGVALGTMFGSVAIGVAAGPLVGLALGMATWLILRRVRNITKS